MGIFHSLTGSVRIELTSADVATSLHAINWMKIPVIELNTINDLTVQFTVMRCDMKYIEKLADKRGDHLVILSYEGIFWTIQQMKQRLLLLFGLMVLVVCAVFTPTRILFVTVEGNEKVPTNIILEAAQEAGIKFGNSRRSVRSEIMKNRLLGNLPQLQWAGVNTHGCTAVISVRERDEIKEKAREFAVSHMIASEDGIITSCVVTAGSGLCKEGQAVLKGQVLISGYTDCGGIITSTCAQGEVFAQTKHTITAYAPAEMNVREDVVGKQTRYSVQFGKKRINFYKGSGISGASCVKIISKFHFTLPGGYTLPVLLIKEEQTMHQSGKKQIDDALRVTELSDFSRGYIQDNAVALTVMDAQEMTAIENGMLILNGTYHCTEMIGRELGVQIGDLHGKTD